MAYVAETLDQRFQSDLGSEGILAVVLLLTDQRRDLSNYRYLHERAVQSILSGYPTAEVHALLR